MNRFLSLILILLLTSTPPVWADLEIPVNLSRTELADVTEILGFSTGSKFLSNPYPLGGYSGFEVGFATEFINTTDLSELGAGTPRQSTFQYNRITVGKGLYNNLDAFVHFVPFSNSNEIYEYGGILKLGLYEAQNLPFTFSVLGNVSTINMQDLFINENLGWDLLGGFNLSQFSLYFGGGRQFARSTFSKNILDSNLVSSSLNAQGTLITHSDRFHSFVGLQLDLKKMFLAGQIDRYDQPVYSAKLGVRF